MMPSKLFLFIYSYTIGIGLSVYLVRANGDGTYKEVEVIDRNLHYDFNYQQSTHLQKEILILPVSRKLFTSLYLLLCTMYNRVI